MVAQFSSDSNDNVNVPQTPETPTPQAVEDNGFTLGQPLDPQPSVEKSIAWVLGLGLSPLPCAPAQADKLKTFGGKNPSYLDKSGIPHTIKHKPFHKRLPTESDLKKWFANPLNGIGAFGSERWAFVDLDRKQFDSDKLTPEQVQELCDAAVQTLIANIVAKTQKLPPYEKTQSGGWRIVLGLSKPANFTNFCLAPGGDHVGELRTVGEYAVLAPSIGPTGNAYVAYHRCAPDEIPVVDSLEEIGLYATGAKSKPKAEITLPLEESAPTETTDSCGEAGSTSPTSTPTSTPILEEYPELRDKVFDLAELGTDKTREVLAGVDLKDDRSNSLTTAIKDLLGWENWCRANGITYRGDTRSLAIEAGKKMPPGKDRKDEMDEERVDWILKGIDANSCTTSCEYSGGSDEGCRKKVLRLAGIKGSRKTNGSNPNANAKVIPFSTATPRPKAVGDSGSPPIPPNYGGGSGGSDPNDEDNWRQPILRNGKLGYWVYPKKEDKKPYFDIKTNFDFVVVKELERYKTDGGQTTPNGGDLQLKITRASDGKTRTVLISSEEYSTTKTFTAALNNRFGGGIKCRLSDYDLNAILEVKTLEYQAKGGKVYSLASTVGRQPDGVRVFPNLQIDANGKVLTEEESPWVYNPHISEIDHIPSPDIPVAEDPKALRELLEAQRQFAQANFMRFWLLNGWVAACLHEQDIMRQEKFMPIINAYGDGGSAKTTAMDSALSLIWGDSGNGMIASASVSMAYERLAKTGSIPCFWDDPPSKDKKERDALDEFVKRQYNKALRTVRGNKQKPISSIGITSNHCVGETLPATATRIVGVFFPKVPGNKDAYPRLLKAMAQAPGAFRSILTIGYNQIAVHETRKRLIPHLLNAHDRTPDNWALIVWYAQKVVELAGMDIDVEAWFIENICPTLNEDQAGLDSSTDFIKRLMALHTENKAGTWNAKVITNRSHGECLALDMKTLWSALDRPGDPPPYNQKLLESVLVNKGCVRGVPTKFFATRDGVLNYLRELGKGANQGDNWIPPTPPPQTSKRALLIPKRLWDEFGFDPDALAPMPTPPTPPSDDSAQWDAWDEGDAPASSYTPVTPSYVQLQENVTSSNADVASALGSSLTPSYVVTKKELEKREKEEPVGKVSAQEKNDDAIDAPEFSQTSKVASQKSVTSVTGKNPTPETSTPQGVELVTNECNLDVTMGGENVTSPETNPQTQALTPDLTPELALAAELIHCNTWAKVQEKTVGVSSELFNAALESLEDSGERIRRLETDALAQASTPNLESPTPNASTNKDASDGTVVKRFRYVGSLSHTLKDTEGNPITDAEGKPLVLKGASELILEEVERSVNADYANVRPLGVDCRPLGLRRSQLEEV